MRGVLESAPRAASRASRRKRDPDHIIPRAQKPRPSARRRRPIKRRADPANAHPAAAAPPGCAAADDGGPTTRGEPTPDRSRAPPDRLVNDKRRARTSRRSSNKDIRHCRYLAKSVLPGDSEPRRAIFRARRVRARKARPCRGEDAPTSADIPTPSPLPTQI